MTLALLGAGFTLAPAQPAAAQAVAFDSGNTISSTSDGARWVHAADMDHDGDQDVVTASENSDTIAWYENDGASPPTFTLHVVATDANGATAVYVADLNGDGDIDILEASFLDNKVAWYESNGATPPAFTTHNISTTATSARTVHAADIDGDGDLDVIAGLSTSVVWYRNDGGSPPVFSAAKTVQGGLSDVRMVRAADMDKDGDPDVLFADDVIPLIRWNENSPTTRAAASWAAGAHDVAAPTAPWSVEAADVDRDGDIDVVSESSANDGIRLFTRNNTGPAIT